MPLNSNPCSSRASGTGKVTENGKFNHPNPSLFLAGARVNMGRVVSRGVASEEPGSLQPPMQRFETGSFQANLRFVVRSMHSVHTTYLNVQRSDFPHSPKHPRMCYTVRKGAHGKQGAGFEGIADSQAGGNGIYSVSQPLKRELSRAVHSQEVLGWTLAAHQSRNYRNYPY